VGEETRGEERREQEKMRKKSRDAYEHGPRRYLRHLLRTYLPPSLPSRRREQSKRIS